MCLAHTEHTVRTVFVVDTVVHLLDSAYPATTPILNGHDGRCLRDPSTPPPPFTCSGKIASIYGSPLTWKVQFFIRVTWQRDTGYRT